MAGARRIPFWVKVGYGGFGASERIVESAYYAFFLFFLTDVAGLSPLAAGTVMLVGSVSDGVSDLFAGVVSDRLKTRWGRRRPILLAVAVPYGLASWLLFTDLGLTGSAQFVYYCALVAVFYSVSDFVVVPGKALGVEMSLDYDERTSVNGSRMFWSFAGNAAGTASALLLAGWFGARLGDPKAGWSAMGACLGMAAVIPILITWRVTRGYEIQPQTPPFSLRDLWGPLVDNRVLRNVLLFTTTASCAQYFFHGTFVYYLTYWMGFDKAESSYVYAAMGLCAIASPLIFTHVGRRLGKRRGAAWMCGTALVGLAGLGLAQPGQQWLVIASATISMSCIGNAFALIGGAMISDAVDVEEFKNGKRREGYYYALAAVCQKVTLSLVYGFIGWSLGWFGYQPGVEQAAETLGGIRILITAGPATLAILAIVIVLRSPMTRRRHASLVTALEAKKQGSQPDTAPIRELIA